MFLNVISPSVRFPPQSDRDCDDFVVVLLLSAELLTANALKFIFDLPLFLVPFRFLRFMSFMVLSFSLEQDMAE